LLTILWHLQYSLFVLHIAGLEKCTVVAARENREALSERWADTV